MSKRADTFPWKCIYLGEQDRDQLTSCPNSDHICIHIRKDVHSIRVRIRNIRDIRNILHTMIQALLRPQALPQLRQQRELRPTKKSH